MPEFLIDYGWWILGLVLLALELALPGVFLVFFGIAALIVGMNVFVLGTGWFGWQQQIIAFVILSAAAALLGRRWYGSKSEVGDADQLNRRTARLIGRQAVLTEAIVDGRGRVAIEDGWWTVTGPDLPVATHVRIVGADGSMLVVEAA
ncbi:NfeD family protein [Aurantimonas sp. A2-1-M11]|uniref:NfeD family protein n=1 Tax=Aurantimonas sp. A2-1-M11 TaxID=3113712 RepID=UPI002F93C331